VGFEATISAGERPQAAHMLRSWVRIPPGAWIFVCCECRLLSGRGLCDELITRPEESYRLWCVVVCDLETPRIGVPYINDISNVRGNTKPSSTRRSPIGLSPLKSLIPICNYFSRPAPVQHAWTPHFPDLISTVISDEEYNPSHHLLRPHVTFSFVRYKNSHQNFFLRRPQITLYMSTAWTTQVSYSYNQTNTPTKVRFYVF